MLQSADEQHSDNLKTGLDILKHCLWQVIELFGRTYLEFIAMLYFSIFLVIFAAALPFAIIHLFGGADHSDFDTPRPELIAPEVQESVEHQNISKLITKEREHAPKLGRKESLAHMRRQMDQRGLAKRINARVEPVKHDAIRGEWIIANGASTNRRLLYIHGGAYMVGSPKSHRAIAEQISLATNASVFVVQYRLLPEHKRLDGIQDCRDAYQWVLGNGPDGAHSAEVFLVAGDSSGGNIALSVLAWARDTKQRPADAAIVFSPQTDITLSSPSLVSNIETDVMQGASFGPIVRAPKCLRLMFSFLMHRINPKNPVVSPLLGDLSNLPPTLIQASNTEMFLDDAVRYANKANSQNSCVTLQVWPFTLHVWQAFQTPEAKAAFERVGKYIALQVENKSLA